MKLLDLTPLLLGAVIGAMAVYLFMRLRFKQQEQELLAAQTILANEQDKSLAMEKFEKQIKDTFDATAANALKNNNEAFIQLAQQTFQTQHESAKGELDQRAKSVSESLERFDKNLNQLHEAHGGLMSRIDGLGKETENLVSALQTPKVIGNWGEMQLRKVAEIAGMEEHCDFDVQKNISTDESRLIPDMIVRLPGGRSIVVDSKVPLKHFLASFEAEGEENEQHAWNNTDAVFANMQKNSEARRIGTTSKTRRTSLSCISETQSTKQLFRKTPNFLNMPSGVTSSWPHRLSLLWP